MLRRRICGVVVLIVPLQSRVAAGRYGHTERSVLVPVIIPAVVEHLSLRKAPYCEVSPKRQSMTVMLREVAGNTTQCNEVKVPASPVRNGSKRHITR